MRRSLLLVPAVLPVVLLVGCADEPPAATDGVSTQASGAACVPAPPLASVPPVPGSVALPPGAVLTAYGDVAGAPAVTGRVEAPVEQVLAHFRTAIERAGLVVTGEEDEGRAAELAFFGSSGDGTLTVSRLTCPRGETGFTLRVRTAAVTGED